MNRLPHRADIGELSCAVEGATQTAQQSQKAAQQLTDLAEQLKQIVARCRV